MRLFAIFLGVLATSVIITSLAAWGITFGSSYSRVTTMAAEFTQLAHDVLLRFDVFVAGLLQDNANLVGSILAAERQSGDSRMQQTKAQVMRIIGTLVNYTTNATGQSQQQMSDMADSFVAVMGAVVADFRGVASSYASELRLELATKTSTTLFTVVSARTLGLQRFQGLYDLGVLDLSRPTAAPIGSEDCVLLGAVYDVALEFGYWESLTVVSAAGRYYYAVPGEGATLSMLKVNGSQYTEYLQTWLPNGVIGKVRQRCAAEQPVWKVVGQNCSLPQSCQCGIDQRCSLWYVPHVTSNVSRLRVSDPYIGKYGVPQITLSYPLVNSSDPASPLLAVASTDFAFSSVAAYLTSLGLSNTTYVVVVLNDSNLSLVASLGRKCGVGETPPGDPSLPLWSALRACDPTTLAVAQWLAQNRGAMAPHVAFELGGILWDAFADARTSVAYFCIVGSQKADVYRAIDASDVKASSELSNVRAQQLSKVAASGVATQAYMAVVQAQNIQEVEAMQDAYLVQMDALEAASRSALAASQDSSTSEVERLMSSQASEVDGLKAHHLNALAVATGWILAVVLVILVVALLVSAWGTVRITRTLTNIITLMEDVAHMRVDDLRVPQNSQVTEVARIQSAFQVLVLRLAEYKGYMPAGLFEQDLEEPRVYQRDTESNPEVSSSDGPSTQRSKSSFRDPSLKVPVSGSLDSTIVQLRRANRGGGGASLPIVSVSKPAKKNVAVLCLNLVGFRTVMGSMAEGVISNVFNNYLTLVHEAVSQGRGNLDCLLGDQLFATFNAHIPCADPACAAASAVVEVESQLSRKIGDRLRFQMGVSFGVAVAGTVGYHKFKSMVTIGWPMKVASILSHLSQFESGTILTDALFEERAKYSYALRPVELVHLPKLTAGGHAIAASSRVYQLQGKRQMEEDEWLYQLEREAPDSDWDRVFSRLVNATSLEDQHSVLQQHLEGHPEDAVALRLKSRLPLWTPGVGVALCEGVEHLRELCAEC